MKRCNRCGIEKSVEDFYRSARNGRQGYCKACDKIRRQSPEIKQAKKEKAWRNNLRQYGITEGDYWEMFERQLGLCAICHKPESDIKLAVDHDHETGEVRGLLCKRCNMAIGLLGDDPHVVTNAALYLKGKK